MLHLAYRNAADAGRSLFADDGDGAFEILGPSEHGNGHGFQRPVASEHVEHTRVLDRYVPPRVPVMACTLASGPMSQFNWFM